MLAERVERPRPAFELQMVARIVNSKRVEEVDDVGVGFERLPPFVHAAFLGDESAPPGLLTRSQGMDKELR